jgi:hypothetical protein
MEGNSQRKSNLKVISDGGGLSSTMSDPWNNKPHVATYRDLRLGSWRCQEHDTCYRYHRCKTSKQVFEHFSLFTFLFELVFLKKRGGLRWGAAVKSSGGAECEAVTLEDKPGRTSAHRQLTVELDSLQMESVEALFHLETQYHRTYMGVFRLS